jgi:hypothetical protein
MKTGLTHMKAEGKYNTSNHTNHTKHTWWPLCDKLERGDKIADHIDFVTCPVCKAKQKGK